MPEVLSQTLIESEEANFRQHIPPRLKLIHPPKEISIQDMKNFLMENISKVRYWQNRYHKEKLNFPEKWGFMAFKYLMQCMFEYILIRQKNENSRLNADEIQQLTSCFKTDTTSKHWLLGAKLGLLIDSQEALTDEELFYLTQEEEILIDNTLGIWPEECFKLLLEDIEKQYHRKKKILPLKKNIALGCCLFMFFSMGCTYYHQQTTHSKKVINKVNSLKR
jgi:hypothetical protein